MDMTKTSGVLIEKINLLACKAQLLEMPEKPEFNLILTHLARTEKGNSLFVEASFDLFGQVEKPACLLVCTFGAVYSRTDESQMTWAGFTDELAVLHLVPFVREFVSSVTLRMPVPALILQPTNVSMLVAEYRARKIDKSASAIHETQKN